ncbi:MAG: magnesium transporter [Alphaproteobacteria bacterium]|nr:magnesium transporter [Alphaproteobacteria bacterium]
MTGTGQDGRERDDPEAVAVVEEDYSLATELIYEVEAALDENDLDKVQDLIEPLHVADVADLLEYLTKDERRLLIEAQWSVMEPEVLVHLDAGIREEVIEQIGRKELARALSALDSDDAVDVFEDLDEEAQHRILSSLPQAYRHLLEESLSYPEDSAGRLMQREMVVIPSTWTVGQTIDFMRSDEDLPDDFYDLFIVNPKHKPIGAVPLSRVLRTKRPVKISDLMAAEIRPVSVTMDQEQVAFLFRQYDLASAPVVSEDGRLVGVITHDDVLDVVDEEAEEDLMRLGGVTGTDLYRAAIDTTRSRFPWLVVNLATAIVASIVIGFFEATIQQIVALAVLMPIVASMGGNAGTQTLTVAVRALAMKELTASNALRIVGKEALVGGFNGLLFAVLVGIVAWLWFASPDIGIVIAAAMAINLVVAGLAGVAIPIGLERTGIDPAVASVVLLTTITDVVGFAVFLGLAALFLI